MRTLGNPERFTRLRQVVEQTIIRSEKKVVCSRAVRGRRRENVASRSESHRRSANRRRVRLRRIRRTADLRRQLRQEGKLRTALNAPNTIGAAKDQLGRVEARRKARYQR